MPSKSTQFKKGQHWRPRQRWWDKAWLEAQYKSKSAQQIANENDSTANNILYWIHKLGIRTRTPKESRASFNMRLVGKDNPMYGRRGKRNPRWNGGHSPNRQITYARAEWKRLKRCILQRDGYKCLICAGNKKLIIHHVFPWSRYPAFRETPTNLATLCTACHRMVHRKVR